HWPDAEKNPARALRVARLRRYEGKLDDARRLIAVALSTSSRGALIEKALIDAEGKDERKRAVGSLDAKLEPERPWLEVYLYARQGPSGLLGARKALTKAKTPPPDAPLSLRIVAALAIAEMADPVRVEFVIRPLLGTWGANPDVIRAGVGVG